MFGIDGLIGQLFVVTHSPNVLSDDYKNFQRLCIENGQIVVVSGCTMTIEDKDLKHLMSLYDEIKIAFFGRNILLVEGDTEKGAFPIIASKNGIDFDEIGCTLIKMGGADNVCQLSNVFKAFKIPAYAFLDRDKYDKYKDEENVFFTDNEDYENEIVPRMSVIEKIKAFKILGAIDDFFIGIYKRNISGFNVKEYLETKKIPSMTEEEKNNIDCEMTSTLIESLKKNKNQVSSIKIIDMMTEYPQSMVDFIKKAVN